MKPNLFTGFSLALNVALAAAILFSTRRSPTPASTPQAAPVVSNTVLSSVPTPDMAASPGLPFQWSQIAAEDLKTYRDNLRAVGCPETTVREIIRAVINERFGARRRSLLAPLENRYWDMVLHEELVRRQAIPQTEWGRALTALAAERQRVIAEVLGGDALTAESTRLGQRTELELKRTWLPAEKRDRLIELEEKHRQLLVEWAANLGLNPAGAPTADDGNQLQELQKLFEEAETQLLTPEELAELHLRESDAADWAGNLPGFDPSEDEWRAMTKLRLKLEDGEKKLGDPELTDEERTARQNELQAGFDEALKEALGSGRYAEYKRADDGQFQGVRNVTRRYGLPDDVAVAAYEIQQAAQTQAQQVTASPELDPDARLAALTALQQETERALGGILNSRVLATYKEYNGDWLRDMAPTQ